MPSSSSGPSPYRHADRNGYATASRRARFRFRVKNFVMVPRNARKALKWLVKIWRAGSAAKSRVELRTSMPKVTTAPGVRWLIDALTALARHGDRVGAGLDLQRDAHALLLVGLVGQTEQLRQLARLDDDADVVLELALVHAVGN